LVVLYITNRRDKALAGKAQQVMLACAYFDSEGNIMVTNEGLLPSQKVAKRFHLTVSNFGLHISCAFLILLADLRRGVQH